jgi:shikimate dehydrogenase
MPTHRAAVLGSPVAHSLSPLLHRTAYAATGLDDWAYDAHEVRAGGLADFLVGLGPQWRGLSLTMPLKEESLLLATERTPLALQVGAGNTLVRRPDGGWLADNTDVAGVRGALCAAHEGGEHPARATIIGSGATARAVLAALDQIGITEVTFVVRDQVRESTLAQAHDHGMTVSTRRFSDPVADWADAQLMVSTTPPGAADTVAIALAQRPAPPEQVVLDCVYADWPTSLATISEQRGARVLSGVEMLVHQAAAQFRMMTGVEAPLEAMTEAGRAALEPAAS